MLNFQWILGCDADATPTFVKVANYIRIRQMDTYLISIDLTRLVPEVKHVFKWNLKYLMTSKHLRIYIQIVVR